jgi:hypothetical protein
VGVGGGVRAGQPASTAKMTALTATASNIRRLSRVFVFFTLESLIALLPVLIPKVYPNFVWDIAWIIACPIA